MADFVHMHATLTPARGTGFAMMVLQPEELTGCEAFAKRALLHLEIGLEIADADSEGVQMWAGFSEGLAVMGSYYGSRLSELGYENQYAWFERTRMRLRKHRRHYTKFPDILESDEFIQYSREWLVWSDPETYTPLLETFVRDELFTEPAWPVL